MSNKELATTTLNDKNQTLLLGLYQYSQSAKPIFAVRLSGLGKNYPELDLFRQQIEIERNGIFHLPYSAAKKKVLTYKSVFLVLGLLFLGLGVSIYLKTLAFSSLFFTIGAFHIAKNLICGICVMAGLGSLLICKSLRTEKEVINHLVRKARRNLAKIHARKRIENGIKTFFSFGAHYRKSQHLRHTHHEAHDKIHDLKEETFHLIERIAQAGHLNSHKKESLYNQALLEMGDKLEGILLQFRQFKLSHL